MAGIAVIVAEGVWVAGMFKVTGKDELWYLSSFLGKPLLHFIPQLEHEQFLLLPVPLHRQQVITEKFGES